MGKLRIGIVGLGAAAKDIHLPAIQKTPSLELVGGVDPLATADQHSFPIFSSLEEMQDRTAPDIVAIVTPPQSHYALICQALDSGAHVFCEKPFVETLAEGRDVIARAAAANRYVVVNNEFRFMNVHEAAHQRIGTDGFGKLLFVSINQTFFVTSKTEAGWRGESNRRTCFEFGTHALDLCRYFFGEEPSKISARMPKPGRPDGPDYLNLIQMEFSGDRVAHITLDRLSRGPHRYLDIRLDGTEACIETKIGGQAEVAFGIRGGSKKPYAQLSFAPSASAHLYVGDRRRKLATDPLDLFANSTAKLLGAMASALDGGRLPPCSAADNLNTLALMLAAYASSDQGGVYVSPDGVD